MAPPPIAGAPCLGKQFAFWWDISRVPGIKAVIKKWGNPLPGGSSKRKQDLIVEALNAVKAFRPRLSVTEVQSLISLSEPEKQTAAQRQAPGPTIGKSIIAGGTESPPIGSPTVAEKTPPAGRPNRPEPGGTQIQPYQDAVTDNETVKNTFTICEKAEGPERSRSITLHIAQRSDGDDEILHSLLDIVSRSFHCPPKIVTDYHLDQPPKRPVAGLGDLTELGLSDLFDNVHDPGIMDLKLKVNKSHDMALRSNGSRYPYRGRGPKWYRNSCAMDCVVVAARLLDLGKLQVDAGSDKGEDWLKGLDAWTIRCLQAFNEPWDILTLPESARRGHEFFRAALAKYNSGLSPDTPKGSQLKVGIFYPVSTFWDLCTETLSNQFTYNVIGRRLCHTCNEEIDIKPKIATHYVDLRSVESDAKYELSMQDLLARHFAPPNQDRYTEHEICKAGGSKKSVEYRKNIVHEDMPIRLAVRPADTYRHIKGATHDSISFPVTLFKSASEGGKAKTKVETFHYRWLGGFYNCGNAHWRVYWNDSDLIERKETLKVYDGKIAGGSIIGDLPFLSHDHAIPRSWAADILFYERINTDRKEIFLPKILNLAEDMVYSPETKGVTTVAPETPLPHTGVVNIDGVIRVPRSPSNPGETTLPHTGAMGLEYDIQVAQSQPKPRTEKHVDTDDEDPIEDSEIEQPTSKEKTRLAPPKRPGPLKEKEPKTEIADSEDEEDPVTGPPKPGPKSLQIPQKQTPSSPGKATVSWGTPINIAQPGFGPSFVPSYRYLDSEEEPKTKKRKQKPRKNSTAGATPYKKQENDEEPPEKKQKKMKDLSSGMI